MVMMIACGKFSNEFPTCIISPCDSPLMEYRRDAELVQGDDPLNRTEKSKDNFTRYYENN